MTRNLFITVACILTFRLCSAQVKYEPQILILSPNEMTYDKVFEKEISKYNDEIKESMEHRDAYFQGVEDMETRPENIRIMMQNEITFSKTLDFSKQTSLIAEQYLAYRFFEKFTNLLITVKDIKCKGDVPGLKKIASEQNLQYVLNFPKINFYKEEGISKAKISVQLYDQVTNTILLNKDYVGDWYNPGFEFSCYDSTLECTISNALAGALSDVIDIVAKNSPTLQREKVLAQERFDVLMNEYYLKPYNTDFINSIISSADSNINSRALYQCLVNESKTKFIAFYLEKSAPHNFGSLKDDKKDMNVNIISDKDIKDPGFLDDIPQTYAYIVKGVKYNDKWYYTKAHVTYFEAKNMEDGRQNFFNNLQKWDFFKEDSADFNPSFWEGKQFRKIKDLTKDPDWNKYKETIWNSEERENRDYIGMYEIVVDELKKIKREEDEAFHASISDSIFKPFHENQKKKNPREFSDYVLLNKKEFILIFPKDRDVILNPIQIINSKGEKAIRYFLLFRQSGKFYEWTYFIQHPFDEKQIKDRIWGYSDVVMAQLNTLTKWNFAFTTLDDKNFWDAYVLAKSGDDYKYIKPVK